MNTITHGTGPEGFRRFLSTIREQPYCEHTAVFVAPDGTRHVLTVPAGDGKRVARHVERILERYGLLA